MSLSRICSVLRIFCFHPCAHLYSYLRTSFVKPDCGVRGKALVGSRPAFPSTFIGRGLGRCRSIPRRILESNVVVLRPAAGLQSGLFYYVIVYSDWGPRKGSLGFLSHVLFGVGWRGLEHVRRTLRRLLRSTVSSSRAVTSI